MKRSALALLAAAASLSAAPITRVVAFGDSLSDNGNLFALTGYPPSPPYFNGRASNGPVAVEYVAQLLGTPLLDFAVFGATTGVGNSVDGGTPTSSNGLPGVLTEYANARAAGFTPLATDLIVMLGGPANDFRASNLSPASIPTAIANQVALASALQSQGAQQILVAGLPDLGVTPFVTALGPAVTAQASLLSAAYNAGLRAALPEGVGFFDSTAVIHAILANAGAYGFTNTADPCLSGSTICAAPGQYFFWDDVHPTTRVHEFIGTAMVAQAVPEPATIVLTAAALLAVVLARRKRRALA